MTSDETVKIPRRRTMFTPSEDYLLSTLVEQYGSENNWRKIAEEMKTKTLRQCKERYFQYLDPTINKTPFTYFEDELLVEQVQIQGTAWKQIAQFFHGRTETQLRNRYRSLERFVNKDNWRDELVNYHRYKDNCATQHAVLITHHYEPQHDSIITKTEIPENPPVNCEPEITFDMIPLYDPEFIPEE